VQYIHQTYLAIFSLQQREINKICYDGINFNALKIVPDDFIDIGDRRIAQREAKD
jgi:hypothetical protein